MDGDIRVVYNNGSGRVRHRRIRYRLGIWPLTSPLSSSFAALATIVTMGGGCGAFVGPATPQRSLSRHRRQRPPTWPSVAPVGANTAVSRLTLDEYLADPTIFPNVPVIIRDVVSSLEIESLTDELMDAFGNELITMQRRTRINDEASMYEYENDGDDGSSSRLVKKKKKTTTTTTMTTTYDIPLGDCVNYMMDSNHDDSYFAFCEGLLPPLSYPSPPSSSSSSSSIERLGCKLRDIREMPFAGKHDDDVDVEEEDWFEYFPLELRPTDAIILAGTGATSTLHRDPFEWTGTSLCLEGTKVWRFVLPPPPPRSGGGGGGVGVIDEAFASHRLDSIAWDDVDGEEEDGGRVVLSAGWQSDMSLYDEIDDCFPSGYDWSMMEEDMDVDAYVREMEMACADANRLRPCRDALDALYRIADGTTTIDDYSDRDSSSSSSQSSPFMTAVQRSGDLLLIPAHCWHQTYAPMPSLAVSSQRCGARVDGANVVRHVLDVVAMMKKRNNNDDDDGRGGGIPDELKRDRYEEGSGKEIVRMLIDYVRR
jgi:hypothetical protein